MNNTGKIRISKHLYINNYHSCIRLLFEHFIPLEMKYDAFTNEFILLGESVHFDNIEKSDFIPEYGVQFVTNDDNSISLDKFIKL